MGWYRAIYFGLILGLIGGVIFNGMNQKPLIKDAGASTSFKSIITTTTWNAALSTNDSVRIPKDSVGLLPSEEDKDRAKRELG